MWYRFIPTHVGNSIPGIIRRRLAMVHPHACGELTISTDEKGQGIGSSPRMWGTHISAICSTNYNWFIPTHVGNSARWLRVPAQHMVHPHACGELIIFFTRLCSYAGSSPRMWGTRFTPRARKIHYWFIPTHVGNSPTNEVSEPGSLVHPHACGELSSHRLQRHLIHGSSPRMWGTHR